MSQQINLFNPALLKQKQHLSAVTMAQGLAVILVGAVAFAGYARVQTRELAAQAAAATAQLDGAKAQLAKVVAEHAPRQKSQELAAHVQRLETEVDEQRKAFEIVRRGGVGDTQGYSGYLRAFSRQIVEGLWLTGFTIDSVAKRMELQGRALQPELVPAYIHRLGQEPVMQGKSFAQLMMSRPEAEAQRNGQGGTQGSAAPDRRQPAKYLEFVLKSSGEAPAGTAKQPGNGLLPALPAAAPAAAATPSQLPSLQDARNLRDLAGAH
ncbi:PilN domain-containing protein [Noviherbaspirillum sp. CPCC 100848]|uniref:PilN domain-containing protein n=1 Tax=Noviherbaspirillum album TaxID=3080276 RepID=A0ABU6JHH5_9BURK|nr:PilN domain-containing protein [Noviherbaspirillum sp. CPCC 100848]MEC4722998.1 PilN domain-containing protein [Noviherbaspirillum sp. CPCC 100848]